MLKPFAWDSSSFKTASGSLRAISSNRSETLGLLALLRFSLVFSVAPIGGKLIYSSAITLMPQASSLNELYPILSFYPRSFRRLSLHRRGYGGQRRPDDLAAHRACRVSGGHCRY